ncbi:MAG: glycosyltransferase family 4 protein [Patescibacteria group bacterium]
MSIGLQSRMVQRVQRKEGSHKIHLLHLINSLIIGGAEVALLHYIQALGQEDYDHYVYSFGHDGPIRKRIEALGVPVYFGPQRASIKCPIKFVVSLVLLVRDLLNFVKNKRIHVIQSHLGHANQLAVLIGKLSGTPAFPTVHTTMAFVDSRSNRDPRVYFIKVVNGIIYRIADGIIAVSQEIKDTIRETYALEESKVLVLKNGIVLNDNVTDPEPIEKEFPDSRNRLKLIAVGRLVPLKCFDVLIRAVAEVVTAGCDVLALIAGEGEEQLRLEKLIQDFKIGSTVKLLGLRHDIMDLMKDCDLFVLPSRYEGLSISMIEAMACGLPIIASDAPGLRDYIKHEQNGLLFPVEDHKALAECITRLANDPKLRVTLSQEARASFEREYDMRQNIKPLDMLFQEYAAIS